MKISEPSILCKMIIYLVRNKILRRGYGFILLRTHPKIWGGYNLLAETIAGNLVIPVNEQSCIPYLMFGNIPHEIYETLLINKLAKNCNIMVDIGAHIGFYSCLMWSSMEKNASVFAFEPHPFTYSYLKANSLSRFGIFAHQFIIGESEGPLAFYCSKVCSLSSAVRKTGEKIYIDSTNLDSFFRKLNLIGKIDFIKVDTEGGELSVLRGARDIISAEKPPIWMIEFDNNFLDELKISDEDVFQQLSDNGKYRIFVFDQSKSVLIELDKISQRDSSVNVFFIPESRLNQFLRAAKG
jgi:FkbM family methyltransferase